MKHKLLTVGLPVAGLVLAVGIGVASAAGFFGGGIGGPGGFGGAAVSPAQSAQNQATTFQSEATELGLSESVIVNGWAQGQSLQQIATANGISQTQLQTDMTNFAQSQEQAQLQALVTAGTITQAQMNERLQFEQTQQAKLQSMAGQGGMMGHRPHQGPPAGNASSSPSTN